MSRQAYFAHFTLAEIQQSFYEMPRPTTLMRWRLSAPADFEFTLKAWQLITHEASSPTYRRLRSPPLPEQRARYGSFKQTEEVRAAWDATLEAAQMLRAGAIVFQCPASFTPTDEHIANLRAFFQAAGSDARACKLCWEPRGAWPRALVLALCQELGLQYVVDPFKNEPPPGDFQYFRLHGRDGYAYRYTDADLAQLAAFCRGTTYCLFNNTAMADDALRFRQLTTAQ